MSPLWAICTRERSTPSSSKISICRGAVSLAGREWAMIGAPGADAGPGDRAVHLLDVLGHARLVGGALQERGLDLGALDPLLDVVDEQLRDLRRASRDMKNVRQVVVGVDAGAGHDLKAGLLGDPAHKLDVAAEEHRSLGRRSSSRPARRSPRAAFDRRACRSSGPDRGGLGRPRRPCRRAATGRATASSRGSGARGRAWCPSSAASTGPVTVSTVAMRRSLCRRRPGVLPCGVPAAG